MSPSYSTFFWDSETRPIDYGTPVSATAAAGFYQAADMDWYSPVLAEQGALREEQRRVQEQARIDSAVRVREFTQIMMNLAQQGRGADWFAIHPTEFVDFRIEHPSTQEIMDKFGETTEY